VQIANNYDVKSFNGAKSFVVATSNVLGGQNQFLGACYLLVGTICLVMAIIFGAVWFTGRKQAKK
jgi:hypothetical protein